MWLDAHIHTYLSPDSEMDPAEAIRVLRQQGLGACFTEHVDFATPADGRDFSAADTPRDAHDFVLSRLDEYPECHAHYRGGDVLLGLEIGLSAAFLPLNKRTAAKEGLDYVIGSVHFVDGWDLGKPGYYSAVPDPYRRMLEYTREMIEAGCFFDSLGHIDYISRYSPFTDKPVWYASYPGEYDAVFKALAARDTALEINTSRLADAAAEAALLEICRRFRALGGKYVTIGSDAHHTGALGRHYGKAAAMARETGLKPVYFQKRVRHDCT